jgi:WD40 repeat protein
MAAIFVVCDHSYSRSQTSLPGFDQRWAGQLIFDLWVALLKQQGKEKVLEHREHSATVACIDWSRFGAIKGEGTAYIEHWWAKWDGPTSRASGIQAMKLCHAWKEEEKADCACEQIAQDMRPTMRMPTGVDRWADATPPQPPTVSSAVPRLVLQTGHAPEPIMTMLAPGAVQSAYQNGNRYSTPVAVAQPIAGLDLVLTQSEGVVITWDRRTGEQLQRLPKSSPITSFAVSADGAWLLTRDQSSQARLWHLPTGTASRSFDKVEFGVALSADGALAVLSSDDPEKRGVYETASGRLLMGLGLDDFSQAEFSANGDRLLTWSFTDVVTFWDIKLRRLLFRRKIRGMSNAQLDAMGERVVITGSQLRLNKEKNAYEAVGALLHIYDSSGVPTFELERTEGIRGVALTSDPDRLVVLGKDAQLWSISESKRLLTFATPETSDSLRITDLWDVTTSADGLVAITLHDSGHLKKWDLKTGNLLASHSDPNLADATDLALSAAGDEVITFSGTPTAPRSWSTHTLLPIHVFARNSRLPRLTYSHFLPDGKLVVGNEENAVVWDFDADQPILAFKPMLAKSATPTSIFLDSLGRVIDPRHGGRPRTLKHPDSIVNYATSTNARFLGVVYANDEARLWDVANGESIVSFNLAKERDFRGLDSGRPIALSKDGSLFATATDALVEVRQLNGVVKSRLALETSASNPATLIAFSPSGARILIGYADDRARVFDTATGESIGNLDLRLGEAIGSFEGHGIDEGVFLSEDVAFAKSMNGRSGDWRHGGPSLIQVDHAADQTMASGSIVGGSATFEVTISRVLSIASSPNGQFLATGGVDGTLRVWDRKSGKRLGVGAHGAEVVDTAFAPDGMTLATVGDDGSARLWRVNGDSLVEVGSLVNFTDGQWAVFTPMGRFNTNQIDRLDGMGWVMEDAPFRRLSPEVFMRDYFEPRLLSRIMACGKGEIFELAACESAFAPVRSLASLNRVRPTVRIVKVERGATADEVLVDITVESAEDKSQPNNKYRSDAYDLRLFRDGQLVGQSPVGVAGGGPIEAWRSAAHIVPGADGKTAVRRFAVRLPVADKARPVTFSAYAFNEDRVKSETSPPIAYPVPTDAPPRRRRAYVVSIGINGYDAKKWRLSYAASDAKAMGDALAGLKDYEVVRIDLISPGKGPSLATKAKIRAVLERLAGQPLAADLGAVWGANALAPARPDDLVILSFSGHGHTDRDGAFYLLPADAGADLERDRASFISSEELSQWLRPVDAGQMVLIIDACHSAASVAQPGFKPGPMGDRGLGQLAYDKAMRILAATQVKDVAIESGTLRQGLLTYALVRDGLGEGHPADLDTDGAVTLAEWLRYAETRVPEVYEDIKAGRLRATKDPENVPGADAETRKPQTPALFDFAREQAAIVIAGGS